MDTRVVTPMEEGNNHTESEVASILDGPPKRECHLLVIY